MKNRGMKIFTILIMTLFLVSVGMSAYAQPKGNPPGPKGGPGASGPGAIKNKAVVNRPWEEKADTNNDGIVGKNEKRQWNNRGGNPLGPKGGPGAGI